MIVIGLTGGIGSGKSEVARMLQELGAEVIDADRIGHEAYVPNTETWKAVVAEFGDEILQPTSEIDRKKLGAKVFSDPQAMARLSAIMHPRMYEMIEERIGRLRDQGKEVAVVEAALLVEGGWIALADEVWVTVAPEEAVIQRLRQRSNLSEQEIRQRIRAQISSVERAKYATVVIENGRSLEELRQQVHDAWATRVRGRNN